MWKLVKADSLLIFFVLSLLFIDSIFRMLTVEEPVSFSLLLSFVFLLAFAFVFYFICSFLNGRMSYLLSIVLLGITALLYSSQYVNFIMSRTFYSVYSAGNGAQVLDFWQDIVDHILAESIWIILFFLPAIFLAFFGKRMLSFEKTDKFNRISIICCFALTQATGIGIVFMSGKELNSEYDLYFKNSYPVLSVEKLGLLTTMRIDTERLILGWTPALEAPSAPLEQDILLTSPPSEEHSANQDTEIEKIEYNTMAIDFPQLIANETDPQIKEIHQYFNSVSPTAKNEYTGKFKGYNLIFITAESFSPYAVNQELTPTLYKMVHEGYQFTNFYNPIWGVSTSDGEYVACTGLIPKSGVWSFRQSGSISLPFAMGNQLKKLAYKTLAYHDHTYSYYRRDLSHPNLGYVYKGLGNGLNVKKTWPESDLEMMEKTIPEYLNSQPFHTYYMTVSGHLRYSFSGNYIAWKNKQNVENLPYSDQGKAYLATQIELDRALGYLLAQLESAGIADKTLIAISADHFPYGLENSTIDELAGHSVERNFELYKSTFIVYSKGMEPVVIDKPASSLDIIPTLSNLLGLEYDSRLLIGRDIFSDSEPLVIFLNKSFITDRGSYNSITREFTANEGAAFASETDADYTNRISAIIQGKFYYSAKILDTDYYRKVFGE
ncbi:LTA synthase family protein [Neobacillus sp. LXY-4]|uniref:LTA synthase family protein n=1 Tax=Neobacillus sp. LXY-4 TaxID=3379826 RepID=UPI003EE0C7D9